MTTYTTPHFATGLPERNVRSEPTFNRVRPAAAPAYRPVPASGEAALMADGPTPDWQPGAARTGVPKAAIGALGAALVGGAALAIVLLAPSNKVTKQVAPDPIAQAAAQNDDTQKSVQATTAAVSQLNANPPAAGDAAANEPAQPGAASTQAAPVPAPVQAVIPDAPPVANAPVARVSKPLPAAQAYVPRAALPPVQQAAPVAPAVTTDAPSTPTAPAPADVQAPATAQTPDTSTVTPSTPAPVPAQASPVDNAPSPAPAQ